MRSALAVPLIIIGASIGSTGCYTYTAAEVPVPEGAHVELVMSTEARQALADRNVTFLEYGSKEAGTLTGLVLAHPSDSLFVAHMSRQLLIEHLSQLWFVVPQIQLTWSSTHEQVDHTLGSRSMVHSPIEVLITRNIVRQSKGRICRQ